MTQEKQWTPEECLQLTAPTETYLCPMSANTYGVEFLEFRIREMEGQQRELYHVKKPDDAPSEPITDVPPELEDQYRCIQYNFPAEFLKARTIGTSLVFSVGNNEVPSFRMIERHYFRDKLLKSFDFTLGFCMPLSRNTWEVIYTLPQLEEELEKGMIEAPYETQSDSFYFVGDKMVMHNKAEYAYTA
mmetsp:Transcript_5100/g.10224  ORF Transcript_5100/g.10224 Transcript_5100/m.10224 type:complete len:188 (+) Transcript_5100:129-692(+)|eukprot:CAMPEP_0181347224 /NCGR_PEP_ID=MMETSP1101-20121128/33766_1 /TAXON_ID=46948 /ORGANISM="Rhodomonas abbreviata, Strain Caron Lab Isolate" /LENGTH=187 /DNA_ID=CAMNT_0023459427 /DNA_START=129 /DNA_END=692 /DNA_ORIENTATION=+